MATSQGVLPRIFTVGHSDHETRAFFDLLRRHCIRHLIDVRSIPSSGRFPQFKKRSLQNACASGGVSYRHCPELGNKATDGKYGGGIVHLLQQPEGQVALRELAIAARDESRGATAYFCAEAEWRDCHRQVVAQRLLTEYGIVTTHILKSGLTELHPSSHVLPSAYGALSMSRAFSARDECCVEETLSSLTLSEGASIPVAPGPSGELASLVATTEASQAEIPPERRRRWGKTKPILQPSPP